MGRRGYTRIGRISDDDVAERPVLEDLNRLVVTVAGDPKVRRHDGQPGNVRFDLVWRHREAQGQDRGVAHEKRLRLLVDRDLLVLIRLGCRPGEERVEDRIAVLLSVVGAADFGLVTAPQPTSNRYQ